MAFDINWLQTIPGGDSDPQAMLQLMLQQQRAANPPATGGQLSPADQASWDQAHNASLEEYARNNPGMGPPGGGTGQGQQPSGGANQPSGSPGAAPFDPSTVVGGGSWMRGSLADMIKGGLLASHNAIPGLLNRPSTPGINGGSPFYGALPWGMAPADTRLLQQDDLRRAMGQMPNPTTGGS